MKMREATQVGFHPVRDTHRMTGPHTPREASREIGVQVLERPGGQKLLSGQADTGKKNKKYLLLIMRQEIETAFVSPLVPVL